jgi:hypothetical protein
MTTRYETGSGPEVGTDPVFVGSPVARRDVVA